MRGAGPFGDIGAALDARARAFRDEQGLAGLAAAIVVNQEAAWTAALGSADQETGRAVHQGTLFRVASISKTLVATAVLQLRDRGILDLDDPAIRYLPELAFANVPHGSIDRVSVRSLLSHTSGLAPQARVEDGLPRYPWPGQAPGTVLEQPDRLEWRDAPGSAFRYSNIGYGLLGVMVERLTSRDLGTLIGEAITGPLGMDATVLEPRGALAGRCAIGYVGGPGPGQRVAAEPIESAWMPASGGYWSSLDDMVLWVGAQLAPYGPGSGAPTLPGVLERSTMIEMHRQVVVVNRTMLGSWGLGWHGQRCGDLVTVGHSGGLPGFTTRIAFSPWDRVGVVVLANGSWDGSSLAMELLGIALPAVRESGMTRGAGTGRESSLAPSGWHDLPGVYRDPDDRVRVEIRDGCLVRLPEPPDPGASVLELQPTDDPLRFVARDGEGRTWGSTVFVRGADGRIAYLTSDGFAMVRADD